ncbi:MULTISPECIES: helix-turn-helix domain-containing protein [unclassified Bacillus (in: firmicutes)]|uniref:helix-turn-helix domain-containing protein n=1 Tax=unclassified Bacillus (in: firmicutes) TaxID=185979 RepID=UPI001BEB72CB|nr:MULTISPECIES: helix-turn-helix transcriptional regulator [unclassified Bacillus (in: firmicutes)]MBT2616124.1 helix-turn-helix transcriptional regulator [Bacillus sp. ISL-78]MBT2628426.1 helix-turn-helix transcriptional regulator [Bacillus sp. ISL-101]
MSINNIGRDIKALRTKRGIGSRELSRLIGKAETYISQLERGLIKKLDYNTAYDIMKHLGFTESGIDEFLDSFYQIKSPARIEAEAEQGVNWDEARAVKIEEMWIQRQEDIDTDREYQANKLENDMINLESQWMMNLYEKMEEKNEEIKKELSFNINKNMQTFEPVINNLYSFLTSMREDRGNFEFFVGLFENDLSVLNDKSKGKILRAVKEEMDKTQSK